MNNDEHTIEDKILKLLAVYPKISPSMMQIGLGNLPAKDWRPVFNDLLARGVIEQNHLVATTTSGRSQIYTIVSVRG